MDGSSEEVQKNTYCLIYRYFSSRISNNIFRFKTEANLIEVGYNLYSKVWPNSMLWWRSHIKLMLSFFNTLAFIWWTLKQDFSCAIKVKVVQQSATRFTAIFCYNWGHTRDEAKVELFNKLVRFSELWSRTFVIQQMGLKFHIKMWPYSQKWLLWMRSSLKFELSLSFCSTNWP